MGDVAVFVPGNVPREPATLSRLGLGALLDDGVQVGCQDGPNGPDGKGGILFTFSKGFYPAQGRPFTRDCKWHAVAPQGDLPAARAFIGWHDDDRPTPDDLTRKTLQPGAWLKLEDGQMWHIPIARQLPQMIGLDSKTGAVVGRTVERYRKFWDTAWESLAWFDFDEDGKCLVDFPPAFAFAVDALTINYRVNADLVTALELVSSVQAFEIPRTVIGYDAIAQFAAQKKTEVCDSVCDTPTTSVGE